MQDRMSDARHEEIRGLLGIEPDGGWNRWQDYAVEDLLTELDRLRANEMRDIEYVNARADERFERQRIEAEARDDPEPETEGDDGPDI